MAATASYDDSRGDDEVYHRDNIFEFFRNHTAYDMLPESGKVRPHAPCGRAEHADEDPPYARMRPAAALHA